jgi:hypothetical protein
MKAYVMTTGSVFGLLTLVHILRIVVEGLHLAKDPFYVLITIAAGSLCLWAWHLLRVSTRPRALRLRRCWRTPISFRRH